MSERTGGPWEMARACEVRLRDLEAQRAVNPGDHSLKIEIKTIRGLLKWCKTRAGYVEPDSTA